MPQYKEGDLVKIFAVDGARWSGIPPEGAVGQIKSVARKKAVVGYGEDFHHNITFYMEDGREADSYHHRFVLPEPEAEEFVVRRDVEKKLSDAGVRIEYRIKLSTTQLEEIWKIVETVQDKT